ncbi:MAG: VCBS repeat-containing protein [Cyclobacteriaceae bacterium]
MAGRWLLFFLILALFSKCSKENNHLFHLVPPDRSGIDFQNTVEETDSINILTIEYMYHGGGVAIGDFNNDGLSDIFFTGNIVPNRLYLNKGGLRFQDVSATAGIGAADKWKSGVAVADINNDGWLDIYVCATIKKDSLQRANMLFIHRGLDPNGIPVFEDQAHSYGVADMGYSQNAAFLDYDRDGDLDLYVLQNLESDKIPSVYRRRILDGSALNNDRLYRNNGNGTFTDVTKEAGILIEGYGLGIAIADINGDSWPDIYIGNDYVSNDVLYINNQDGTFSNEIKDRLKHQSLFTMGIDVADINNDLAPDIITLDMLPENNLRRKTISGAGATYYNYINNKEYNYEFQYMRNMLHINQGNGKFSEIGQMAGIHQTEWSWSSLLVDVDNDGYRDLLVTNGFPKDVTDRDYVIFKREVAAFQHMRSLLDSIPVLKIANYGFRNNGDLTFTDMTSQWGLDQPSFSNGAAFADLDQDGDLDYVTNNINDPAFLYENKLYSGKERTTHFLRLKLAEDPGPAGSGFGAKVSLYYGSGKAQYHEHSIYRGYLSTIEDVIHFGLGEHTKVDSLTVTWPDGKVNHLIDISADQVLTVRYDQAKAEKQRPAPSRPVLLEEVSASLGILYKHKEWDKVDFYRQRTLPHKFSQAGPGLAVGDVNGDGREDFITGGSSLYDANIFIQKSDGSFTNSPLPKTVDKKSEDEGLLLFDADKDGDLDLYCVSGSYEGEATEPHYQDRLYLNDGKGTFKLAPDALPNTSSSGSCVRATDIDGDEDLDLFVGGRVVAGSYPLPAESYILRNDGGRFVNVTQNIAPDLQFAGMITDALWTDYDNDGRTDLIVVGEFMAPLLFKNAGTEFEKQEGTGLESLSGWWNGLAAGDFDKDGDTDYIAGNLGRNNYYQFSEEHPLRVYAKDFDDNGSTDAILSCYFKSEEGTMDEYPAHFWDELFSQSPKFRNQFSSYKQYGKATMRDLLKPYDTAGMLLLKAVYPYSSYLSNNGDGTFTTKALPALVQVAPINGVVVQDVNDDGNLDVLMTGNDYGNEVFSGRYDACTGIMLLGDGKGNFEHLKSPATGFFVEGDGKALAKIKTASAELILATQNGDSLRVFRSAMEFPARKDFMPLVTDSHAVLQFNDGKKQKVEFYHGSGYLSQSTRNFEIPSDVMEMVVHDYSGKSRVIDFQALASQRPKDIRDEIK